LKEEADAYKSRIVAQAQGDAQRFRSLYSEYQKAPQVTRDRLYINAMREMYSNVTKVLVESRQGSNMLYLPLDKIMQLNNASGADLSAPAASNMNDSSSSGSVPSPATIESTSRSRDTRQRDRDSR
jgi:membrane protease subunit HflK